MKTNKLTYKRTASIKFAVEETKEFADYVNHIRSFCGEISTQIHKMSKSGYLQDISGYNFYISCPEANGGEYVLTRDKLKYPVPVKKITQNGFEQLPQIDKVISKYFPLNKEPRKRPISGYIWQVACRYQGCLKRNKKWPKRKIDPLRAAMDFNKSEINVNLDTKQVKIVNVFGKRQNTNHLTFNIDSENSFLGHLDGFKFEHADKYNPETNFYENISGVYIYRRDKRRELMVKVSEERQIPKADKFLGIDLNKSDEALIALSEPVNGKMLYSRLLELRQTEDNIRELENEIKETKKKGCKNNRARRVKLRKRVHKQQDAQLTLATSWVNEIIDTYRAENAGKVVGLAIDTNTTGSSLGTYSHDVIRYALKKYADQNRLPYYEIPTPYTTQYCRECKTFDAKARGRIPEKFDDVKGSSRELLKEKYKNIYSCSCGYEEHADIHAAKNIADRAFVLQDADIPMHNTWSMNVRYEYGQALKDAGRSI